MNKKFVIKMLHAKQLEYEALKEIMPDRLANRLDALGNELLEFGKEYFMTVIRNKTNEEVENSSESIQGVRKVTIE